MSVKSLSETKRDFYDRKYDVAPTGRKQPLQEKLPGPSVARRRAGDLGGDLNLMILEQTPRSGAEEMPAGDATLVVEMTHRFLRFLPAQR